MTKYERYTSKDGATLTMSQWGGSPAELELYRKLAELEDKIENGTLIELPCKVGDTVYVVGKEIEEFEVTSISVDVTKYGSWGTNSIQFAEKETGIRHFDYNLYFSWIGKSVFFTREEAKAKLRELKGERE